MTKSRCWLHPRQSYSALRSRKATERAGSLLQLGANAEMFGERCCAPAEPGVLLLELDVFWFLFFGGFFLFSFSFLLFVKGEAVWPAPAKPLRLEAWERRRSLCHNRNELCL